MTCMDCRLPTSGRGVRCRSCAMRLVSLSRTPEERRYSGFKANDRLTHWEKTARARRAAATRLGR